MVLIKPSARVAKYLKCQEIDDILNPFTCYRGLLRSEKRENCIIYTDSLLKYRVCANKVQYLIRAGKFAFWDISQCTVFIQIEAAPRIVVALE